MFSKSTIIKKSAMRQRLTAKEEEIMNIFWEHGEMCIRDLFKYIPEPKPSYNTVGTQVKFLEDKGFVTRRPVANTFLYSPAISEKEYSGQAIGNVVKMYYNNSYAKINNKQTNNFSITCGVGLPLRTSKTIINVNFEYGNIGGVSAILKENYFKFGLNFSLNETWFVKAKVR